jgi:hypothetical protein
MIPWTNALKGFQYNSFDQAGITHIQPLTEIIVTGKELSLGLQIRAVNGTERTGIT